MGFVIGKGPLQFYTISDNVLGFIWPTYARNINIRFGLNINLGCKIKSEDKENLHPSLEGKCGWLEEASPKKPIFKR